MIDQGSSSNGLPLANPLQISSGHGADSANKHLDELKLPLHDDIMQLVTQGELGPVQRLFEDGKIRADYHDETGTTPLHVRRCGSFKGLVVC